MLLMSWLSWWYGRGWRSALMATGGMMSGISRAFSVPILLNTLFAPWKRIISYPGGSLEAKLRAFADNIVSRAVGFTVRILVLFSALVTEAVVACAGLIWAALWPLLPLLVILLVIKGIIG